MLFAECSEVGVYGFRNSSLTGVYKYESHCYNSIVYRGTTDPNVFLYRDDTDHWIITDQSCTYGEQYTKFAKVKDDADHTECITERWQEFNTENSLWSIRFGVTVHCHEGLYSMHW